MDIPFFVSFSVICFADSSRFTVFEFDTSAEEIQLFLNDATGRPFHRLENLDKWLATKGKHLTFAMNAGMFKPDYSPLGLYITKGKELVPLNLSSGQGNFFMKPNGVFFLTADGPGIVESSKYSADASDVLLATQSGPLLVEQGVIHPAFNPVSKSRFIRNGVGVRGNIAIFVISNEPVTFHELAIFFKKKLKCKDALYLDGVVSSVYLPERKRTDSRVNLGPIIAVVQ